MDNKKVMKNLNSVKNNNKKYILTSEAKTLDDETILYRIEAIKDFSIVKKGDKGGWIQSEKNLSQEGSCWVADEAKVYGNAKVCGEAHVYGEAEVYDDAQIYGITAVHGEAEVYGNAKVYGAAEVYGNAQVYGEAEVASWCHINGTSEIC